MRHKYLFALLLCQWLCGCAPGPAVSDPLPADSAVAKVEIEVLDQGLKQNVRKALPLSFWPDLHKALLPAYEDPNAVKWVVIDKLYITHTNGSQSIVMIGTLGDGSGFAPFCVGPTFAERKYYQGGRGADVEKCYRAALVEAGIEK